MHAITHRARVGVGIGLALSLALLMFGFAARPVKADIDPVGCSSTGGSISLTTYRADGTTPVGGGTVTDSEVIKYKATLGALPSPVCAYQGGAWTLTTPDGVVHTITPSGGIPRIGGTGVASLNSALISYTVTHANEVVDSTRHIDASTSYGGGFSHKNLTDNLAGPTLGTSEQTVVTHTPTVTTNIHNAQHVATTSAPVGSSVHDNAAVTFTGGPTPTGNVAFNLYTNSECTGATTTQVVALVAGTAESNTTTVPSTGMSYKAYYQGDGNYSPAMGVCEPLVASKLIPTVTTDIHDVTHTIVTSVVTGTTVHDKATVSGSGPTPTGTVDFTWYTNNTCTPAGVAAGTGIALVSGVAHPSSSEGPLAVGAYSFKAHYSGDSTYLAGDAACEPLAVTKATPSISTTPSAGGTVGTVLNDTATLTGGSSPTGSVTFKLFPPSDTSCTGAPVYTNTDTASPYATTGGYTSLVAGTYHWTADYAGDTNNNAVSSGCSAEPVVITQPAALQYCSPGYWKNHIGWVGYSKTQLFSSVFEPVTILWSATGKPMPITNATLQQGLEANGGGINQLVRATVNALLNTSAGLNTGWTTSGIIAAFDAAVPGTDTQYSALAAQFTAPENCPLN